MNFGSAIAIRVPTSRTMAVTATAMIQDMPVLVWDTLMMPPMPRTGAYSTMRSSMTQTICTCWMSFVLRVISEAVEKRSVSPPEKETTFLNTLPLRSRPIAAAVREAM